MVKNNSILIESDEVNFIITDLKNEINVIESLGFNSEIISGTGGLLNN